MRLHVKLSMSLAAGLCIVVVVAQVIQYSNAVRLISDLAESNISAMREREEAYARNIFNSVERAVAGSLERGEMEKFNRLIAAQRDIAGVLEFSLYDKLGLVTHSSDTTSVRRSVSEAIRPAVLSNPSQYFRHENGIIEIYQPQMVSGECIRCHKTWEAGTIGGITSIKFSTEVLAKAQLQTAEVLRKAKQTFFINSLLTLAGVILLFMVTMYFSVRKFVRRPLHRIFGGLKELSQGEGDLTRRLEIVSQDELGKLALFFNTFVEKLQSMVAQVQRSGMQITSSTEELAVIAKQQEELILEQLTATDRVLESVEEISSVATDLVGTVGHVAHMSQETAAFAASGQSNLSHMEEAMHGMEEASRTVSSRLATINQKAESITAVVTTIGKVADQTNLISFNAALEAERAGEAGRGFTVVAREVRRLADQTAAATFDIERMVKEMQQAVSEGVMEMGAFIDQVRRSVEDVGKISAQLTRIIKQVQALSPNFESVNMAVAQQSESAQQINAAMSSLSDQMRQTVSSLRESFLAIEQLNAAAKGLHGEVSRFKVE